MRRRLFNLAAMLSLAACIASLVLYARTLGHYEVAHSAGSHHNINFFSWSGRMGLTGTIGNGPLPGPGRGRGHHRGLNQGYSSAVSPVTPGPMRWGFGLHITHSVGPPAGNWRLDGWPTVSVFAPWWFVVAVTAILPAWWLARRVTDRRRRRAGLCPACGYDLRASADYCPECGAVATGGKLSA